MREVHKGICENHSGARSLVHKLIRAGYYWPTMQKDTETYVKACDKCQRFGNVIRQPSKELTPITAQSSFAQQGLDIIGPFPMAVKQLKFLIIGINYFTKWVEAEALAIITKKNIRSFVQKHIICRYRIPGVLVSDNGKQFNNNVFRDFCSELGIKNRYSSPTHPQVNGQVEVTNRSLLKIIKTRLEGQRAYGRMNYQVFYGNTEQLQGHLRGRHHFNQHTKVRQSPSRSRAHKLQGGEL